MSPQKRKSTRSATTGKTSSVWSDEEKAAIREIAKERKAEARWIKDKAEGEKAAVAAIGAMYDERP